MRMFKRSTLRFGRNLSHMIAVAIMCWHAGGCATNIHGPSNPRKNPHFALRNLQYENRDGKLVWARRSLGPGANPDRRDHFERTPLMIAAAFGDPELISMVLHAGADVEAIDFAGNTVLMYAAAYGDAAGIRALLRGKPDLEARNDCEATALHVAGNAAQARADSVRELIEAGCDIDARDYINHTPLARAAGGGGDLARLRVLLEHNHDDHDEAASVQRLNDALIWAATTSRADAIGVLLDSGADLNTVNRFKGAPIHAAALSGDRETISVLVRAGADLESLSRSGATPLILAAGQGSAETTQTLIDAGANLDARTSSGRTALMAVATVQIYGPHGYFQPPDDVYARLDALIAAGADLETEDDDGQTVLHRAASHQSETTRILRLIDAGADVNAVDRQGVTVLMRASAKQPGEVVARLLESGANIRVRDARGRTALMWAATRWSYRAPNPIDLLLQAGADIEAQDNNGWPALAHAADNSQRHSVHLLLNRGADKSAIGWTPLHATTVIGDERGVYLALEAGADPDLRDMWGRTTLMWASRFMSYSPTILQFSRAGADLEATDDDGRTALHHAARHAYREELGSIGVRDR